MECHSPHKVKILIKTKKEESSDSNFIEKNRTSDLMEKKNPIRELSTNINLIKQIVAKSKTSIDITKRENIKKISMTLLPSTEKTIENNFISKTIDEDDSEADSDYSILTLNEDELISSPKKENNKKTTTFKDILHRYYRPPSHNCQGNYDNYVDSCIKLISYFKPFKFFKPMIDNIKIDIFNKILYDNDKYLLVLDLDETMISADLELEWHTHDEIIYTKDCIAIPINIRPFLFEFLEEAIKYFDIVVYTASLSDYADPILDFIERDKSYFKHRLYRQHCIYYENFYIKDLSIFNKPLEKIIIVDNNLLSFGNYLSNGILITSFYNEVDDLDLTCILEFFKVLTTKNDVREELENTFGFTSKLKEFESLRREKSKKKLKS